MNQLEIEKKWQKIWEEKGVFNAQSNSKKEKFFSTVPYPYANSVMHIGHGRAYTTADIYTRYQRLLGKNVLFPMAYHISGTPVLAVADGIRRKDPKQLKITKEAISDYISDEKKQEELLETFTDPQNIANFFSQTMEGALKSIGAGIDWRRDFTTGDDIYTKFVEWQYQKLHEQGILVQGKYPILYSAQDGNAVGEDDIKDGDTDKVSIQEMTYILFKLSDKEEYFSVATLRPDALFGTTNLWVDPNEELVKVKVNDKIWIVTKDALVKLEHQFDKVKVISEHKGEEFIGLKAKTPLLDREVIVAKALFLDPKHGTGLAYSSPAGSPHDYIALQEAKNEGRIDKNVEVVNIVETKDKKGNIIDYNASCPAESKINKYEVSSSHDSDKLELAKQELYKEEHYGGVLNSNCGEFSGVPIKFAKDKVKEKLQDLNLGGTLYETSRRAKTRGGDDVIVANLDGQWFLDYSSQDVKEKAYSLLENMTYNPPKLKETQKGYLKWVEMRPCARRRGIGTPLPYDKEWIIEPLSDSTIYQMFYLIVHIIKREGIDSEQLSHRVFDYILLGEGNKKLISEHSKISEESIEEMRSEVKYWKSFDFRYTAGAHMSNHLSFLIYHYALIFSKEYHPKNITVGGMLIKDGEKISKSKGNGIPLQRVQKLYGSDLYRLYVGVASNYDTEMDFKDEEILQLEKKFSKWKEYISESLTYEKQDNNLSRVDKWLISKFYKRVSKFFEHFENLRMREAYVEILYEFLNDISYHERRTSKKETQRALRVIARDYILLMTPTIPHICEEFFSRLKEKEYASLTKFDTDITSQIFKEDEEVENIVQEVLSQIVRSKESKQLDSIKKIVISQAPARRFDLFDKLSNLLKETKNFKEIMVSLNEEFSNEKKFIQKFVPKTLGSGLHTYLSQEKEKELLEEIVEYLKKQYSAEVEIIQLEDSAPLQVVPGRPGVQIE